jgi:hypothetical protein
MTGSSLQDLLRDQSQARRFAAEIRPADETEIFQSFTFGRSGQRPQLMLCLVKSDGHHLVLPYADLRSITSSNPSQGFHLDFSGREVVIEGSNLDLCFRYLRDHRLSELVEADRPAAMTADADAPIVQRILIRKTRAAAVER